MIQKGVGGDFWGVVLVEVLWKTVTGLLGCRFTSVIQFYDVFHGFGAGRGMRAAFLEAKLIQQLTATMEAVLYDIFLDLQKAYDALDRDRCLEIFVVYGLGPRALQLIQTHWGQIIMVNRSGGY